VSLVGGVGQLIEDLLAGLGLEVAEVLEALAADSPRQVHVLLHDRDSVGVNRAEIRILEQPGEVALSGLLQSEQGLRLETQLAVDAIAYSPDETLERRLGDQKVRRLLIPLDLAEGHSAWPEPVLLLHATLGRCGLLDGFAFARSRGVADLAGFAARCDALLASLGCLRELGLAISLLLTGDLYSWHCSEFSEVGEIEIYVII
jgi:hypothetical protein